MRKSIEILSGFSKGGYEAFTDKALFHFFESPTEWVHSLSHIRSMQNLTTSQVIWSDNFRGRKFDQWSDIFTCLDQVWEPGMAQYREMKKILETTPLPLPSSIRRKRRWNEMEGEIDVDRYLAGEVACFEECFRNRVEGSPVITIAVDICNSASTSTTDLFWNSAAVVAVVDLLESAGYAVEVISYSYAYGIYQYAEIKDHAMAIIVKKAGQPLDISSLVSCLSAFAFRILGQMTKNLSPEKIKQGYGYHKRMDDESLKTCCQLNGEIFNVPNMASRAAAIEMATNILTTLISKQQTH